MSVGIKQRMIFSNNFGHFVPINLGPRGGTRVHLAPIVFFLLQTTTTVHQTNGVQVAGTAVYTTGVQPGYGAPPPGYSQYPAQPPPYNQNTQQYNNPYPQPGTQPTTVTTTTSPTGQRVVNPHQPQPAGSTAHPAPPADGQMYPTQYKDPV